MKRHNRPGFNFALVHFRTAGTCTIVGTVEANAEYGAAVARISFVVTESNAQRLAKALTLCKKDRFKSKREKCETDARQRYRSRAKREAEANRRAEARKEAEAKKKQEAEERAKREAERYTDAATNTRMPRAVRRALLRDSLAYAWGHGAYWVQRMAAVRTSVENAGNIRGQRRHASTTRMYVVAFSEGLVRRCSTRAGRQVNGCHAVVELRYRTRGLELTGARKLGESISDYPNLHALGSPVVKLSPGHIMFPPEPARRSTRVASMPSRQPVATATVPPG